MQGVCNSSERTMKTTERVKITLLKTVEYLRAEKKRRIALRCRSRLRVEEKRTLGKHVIDKKSKSNARWQLLC